MLTYADYSLADVPQKLPAAVTTMLAELNTAPIPNFPLTGTQGAPRIIPCSWAYMAAQREGLITPLHRKRMQEWLAAEHRWRGLPFDSPEPLATEPDGDLMLNDAGKPIATSVWDAQHLILRQYLDIYSMTGNKVPAQMAAVIMQQVKAHYTPAVIMAIENQRELGRLLWACADWYAATEDESILLLAAGLVTRAAQGAWFDGIPYVTINTHAADKADHGFCTICVPQTAYIGWALILWKRLVGLTPKAEAVLAQVYECLRYASKQGIANGCFMVADYGLDGKVNVQPNNALLRECLPLMMEAGGTLAADAAEWWLAADWSRMADKNFDDQHDLSINMAMACKLDFH